jgi:hypothetical protein
MPMDAGLRRAPAFGERCRGSLEESPFGNEWCALHFWTYVQFIVMWINRAEFRVDGARIATTLNINGWQLRIGAVGPKTDCFAERKREWGGHYSSPRSEKLRTLLPATIR